MFFQCTTSCRLRVCCWCHPHGCLRVDVLQCTTSCRLRVCCWRHPPGCLRVDVLQCTTSCRLRVCCWRHPSGCLRVSVVPVPPLRESTSRRSPVHDSPGVSDGPAGHDFLSSSNRLLAPPVRYSSSRCSPVHDILSSSNRLLARGSERRGSEHGPQRTRVRRRRRRLPHSTKDSHARVPKLGFGSFGNFAMQSVLGFVWAPAAFKARIIHCAPDL